MSAPPMEPLSQYREYPREDMLARARDFADDIARRRSVRDFDTRPVPRGALEQALRAAHSAPSAANLQPWHFTVLTDPALRRRVRVEAEREEKAFFNGRAPDDWLEALAPLGSGPLKPFLETAPALIAAFALRHHPEDDGRRRTVYYAQESTGIAVGFMIAALHHAGLATLPLTPSPMAFLNDICGRPKHEKPFLLLVVGYPAPGCEVPVAGGVRKPLAEVTSWR